MNPLVEIDYFNGQVFENESLSNYCTYKIGGPARYLAKVNDEHSLLASLNWAKENNIETFILGGGSNVLFSDDGFDGLVIVLDGDFKKINIDKSSGNYEFGGAVSLAKALNESLNNNLAGLGFCAGIPGTVGGAVRMNAGRKTKWMSSVVLSAKVIDDNNEVNELNVFEDLWGYRTSPFLDDIILSAKLSLTPVSNEEIDQIRKEIDQMNERRRATQPVTKASCGSVFKNPEGFSAGELIEKCDLKGVCIGGAKISDMHANFIVNENNAAASDVVLLIEKIQKTVNDKTGVKLEPELKFVGFSGRVGLY